MSVENIVALVGCSVAPHVAQVYGFVKRDQEGLILMQDGVQYVLTVKTREEFEAELPPTERGFTMYELGEPEAES